MNKYTTGGAARQPEPGAAVFKQFLDHIEAHGTAPDMQINGNFGNFHQYATELVGALTAGGLPTFHKVLRVVLDDPDNNVQRNLSLVGYGSEADAAQERPFFTSLAELFALPIPKSVLAGYLYEEETALLLADAKIGKTFLALHWAFCIAMGLSWHGRKVQQGKVIYIAAEGARGHVKRISALLKHYGITLAELEKQFIFRQWATPLTNDADVSTFIEAAQEKLAGAGGALLVIDTFARSTAGANENDNGLMSKATDNVDRMRRELNIKTALILHHDTKNEGSGRGRGASSIANNLASRFSLAYGDGQKDEREPQIKLTVETCRDDEKPAPLWLHRTIAATDIWSDERLEYFTSCLFMPVNADDIPSHEKPTSQAEQKVLEALSLRGRMTYGTWQKACEEANIVKRSAFANVVSSLVSQGKVKHSEKQAGKQTFYEVVELVQPVH